MMEAEFEISEDPTLADREAILEALVAYNREQGPSTLSTPLAVLIRDEAGKVAGGLWGKTLYDWLVIELVVIPEKRRGAGMGTRLLAAAEEVARSRSCVGAWLDTFNFQARGFYEKLGYRLAGEIPGHPVGGARYILAKRFE